MAPYKLDYYYYYYYKLKTDQKIIQFVRAHNGRVENMAKFHRLTTCGWLARNFPLLAD